jgi:hypothetical protein
VPLSALVHGSWLVTRSLSLPEADWIAVVWVANAGALAVLQMLTLVDSARCYAQHLERERAVVEETLERRYEFERRMVELSTRFVRLPASEIDARIEDALAEIGAFARADRCAVVQFRHREHCAVNSHEWCAPGVRSLQALLQDVPLDWLLPHFEAGAALSRSDADRLGTRAARGRAASGAEDGGRGAAGRGRRPRLQQPPHRDLGLRRIASRETRSRRPAARERGGSGGGRGARLGPDPASPSADARSSRRGPST